MSFRAINITQAYSTQTGLNGVKEWLEKLPAGYAAVVLFNMGSVMMGLVFTTSNNLYGSCLVFNYGGMWCINKNNGTWGNPISV